MKPKNLVVINKTVEVITTNWDIEMIDNLIFRLEAYLQDNELSNYDFHESTEDDGLPPWKEDE